MKERIYDVVIIGAGPAGLTAGLYAGRALLDTIIVEAKGPGGQVSLTHEIENYPGFVQPISGAELAQAMLEQTTRFGVKLKTGPVHAIDLAGKVKTLHTDRGIIRGRTVVIATGVEPKTLNVPGEREYTGRGVSYCATCDGAFFRGKKVCVVGGGNTAVKEALFLTRFAREVLLIHRRDRMRAEQVQQQRLLDNPKIKPLWHKTVEEIQGDGKRMTGVVLKEVKSGKQQVLLLDGVFVFVGQSPVGPLANTELALDGEGYIITDEEMATNIPGVFAVGDVRSKRWRQVVTAVSDGCVAALQAEEYIENIAGRNK